LRLLPIAAAIVETEHIQGKHRRGGGKLERWEIGQENWQENLNSGRAGSLFDTKSAGINFCPGGDERWIGHDVCYSCSCGSVWLYS
jgi:hypothetical protein